MRLFVAIELPEEIKDTLRALQKSMRTVAASQTFVRDFHLTLKFLGEVPDHKVDDIKKRLSAISFHPFDVSLKAIGTFPSDGYIRVTWVGLDDDNEIVKLQAVVEKSLHGLFEKEKDFKPHLTLSRVSSIDDKESFVKLMKGLDVPEKIFHVPSIKLMKSTLTREGPIYEELLSVELGQADVSD